MADDSEVNVAAVHGTGRACDGLRHELKVCLLESDCVKVVGSLIHRIGLRIVVEL